jgi:AP-5 complex subunit zeta-1
MQSVVLEPEQGSARLRLLAAAVLRELAPSTQHGFVRDFGPPVEERNVQYLLPVLLAQGNSQDRLSLLTASHIFRWLTQPGCEEELQLQSLSCLHALCSHSRSLDHLSEEQIRAVGSQMSGWLRHASRSCLPAPTSSSISLFSTSAKKQMQPVKEIDGSTSPDIFTVLSLGGHYSSDQLLNILSFSLLRRWLLSTLTTSSTHPSSPSPSHTPSEFRSLSRVTPSPGPMTGRSSIQNLVSSLPTPLPSPLPHSSHASPTFTASMVTGTRTKQGLRDAAVLYCLRVIDQCERKPTKSSDVELTTACLYECISLLDILCSLSGSLIHGVFPIMRKLFSRYSSDPPSHGRLLLSLVRFFLHHGQSEMYDIETPIGAYFGQVLTAKFNDLGVAYGTIEFLLGNTEMLMNATNIFSKYVPNLLKILAWSPMTFVAEFLQLLPACISPTTASEVLHSLFDLPCLSATLQAQYLVEAGKTPKTLPLRSLLSSPSSPLTHTYVHTYVHTYIHTYVHTQFQTSQT